MKYSVNKIRLLLLLFVVGVFWVVAASCVNCTSAAGKAQTTETKLTVKADELKRMSTFVSNFTELVMMDIDVQTIKPDELIQFGIWHNYKNNYKSRISSCKTKNCEYGFLCIDKKYVAESIKKYFAVDFKDHGGEGYDGKVYHFDGADGDVLYMAEVKDVFKNDKGQLRMIGDICVVSLDDETEVVGTFEAYAKPYKYGGKDTWSIISFKGVEK